MASRGHCPLYMGNGNPLINTNCILGTFSESCCKLNLQNLSVWKRGIHFHPFLARRKYNFSLRGENAVSSRRLPLCKYRQIVKSWKFRQWHKRWRINRGLRFSWVHASFNNGMEDLARNRRDSVLQERPRPRLQRPSWAHIKYWYQDSFHT